MTPAEALLGHLQNKQCLVINPRRRNGVILIKPYHAEFAGPGAFVGGDLDEDVTLCYPVGNLSWLPSASPTEQIKAYLIRRQWTVLLKQIVDNPIPMERAQVILNQLENWFDDRTVAFLPDSAVASLVGVLPSTVRGARPNATVF
ncbi:MULTISPECIES: hypothetical protein [unclassified Synechocystis]|uniref:hypothetical protein n=1 Tax=unclassified Synechocystis TaxID=2640012 RepID=UPI0004015789|nr:MULTISPECIES: hypothetical protein [unclassified Synechocystis]AIE72967.1 hypothetical protein D082_04380 [Synechocystis sp. PCC 6714]